MHPRDPVFIIADGRVDDTIPDSIPVRPRLDDIYVGLYCSSECVVVAWKRGWPKHRSTSK